MEHVPKHIPNYLRKYRELKGNSQKEVAQLLGLKGAGRISEWESGTSKPSLENLIKLSIIYQTLCEQLYGHIRLAFIPKFVERKRRMQENPNERSAVSIPFIFTGFLYTPSSLRIFIMTFGAASSSTSGNP